MVSYFAKFTFVDRNKTLRHLQECPMRPKSSGWMPPNMPICQRLKRQGCKPVSIFLPTHSMARTCPASVPLSPRPWRGNQVPLCWGKLRQMFTISDRKELPGKELVAKGHGGFFWWWWKYLTIVVTDAQLCEYAKHYWITCFKWVHCMVGIMSVKLL